MRHVATSLRARSPHRPAGLFEDERQGADRPALRRAALESTLFYDPPYETPLDDRMARYLVAYLSPAASLSYQSRVWTPWMECRFDFLIDFGTRRVAIDYRDTPENLRTAVEDHDALALGSGNVDVIYRVRRTDLSENPFDVLNLIARWDAHLFTPHACRLFAANATNEALGVRVGDGDDLAAVAYRASTPDRYRMPSNSESGVPVVQASDAHLSEDDEFEWPSANRGGELIVRRLDRGYPEHWHRQYERASLVYGMQWVMRKLEPEASDEPRESTVAA